MKESVDIIRADEGMPDATPETLEDRLRRATRNFTARLPEDEILALGRDLARELARAHGETPPRYPEVDPASVPIVDGQPRLPAGRAEGDVAESLFQLGALLHTLATGSTPDLSWRLDGPPPADLSTLVRRAALAALASPRRDLRVASATAAAESLEAALAPESTVQAPWPLFRGDPGRTGSRPGEASGLAPAWEAPLGGVVGSPALTARLVLVPVADGRLVFLDRTSGRPLHELRVGSALESSPALSAGRLYLGTDDGEVVAVDLASGREVFRTKVGKLVRSSPLAADGRLLVGVVDGKAAGAVVALDEKTGKLLWRRKLAAVFSSPALAGSSVLVGSDDGSLYALALETGALVWSHPLGGRVRATPAVAGDIAVVGDFEGRLAAVRVADGTRVWMREVGQPVYSSACRAGTVCVVGCHDGQVYGIALASGEPVFQAPTRGPVVGSGAAVGERVLIGSTDGDLYLLDAQGRVAARTPLSKDGTQSSPAVDEGFAFVGSSRGLHALRLTP